MREWRHPEAFPVLVDVGDHRLGRRSSSAPKKAAASGNRELGDCIIVVGDVAAVVQVKARSEASGDDARERAWLDKRIEKAARQARGTIRVMSAASTTLANERGRAVEIAGPAKEWVSVVIVDHPDPPNGYTPPPPGLGRGVVLLRRDWEFLFDQSAKRIA